MESRESQEHAKKEALAEEEGGVEEGASVGSAPKPLATRSVGLSVCLSVCLSDNYGVENSNNNVPATYSHNRGNVRTDERG